jgi:hypothetical protein
MRSTSPRTGRRPDDRHGNRGASHHGLCNAPHASRGIPPSAVAPRDNVVLDAGEGTSLRSAGLAHGRHASGHVRSACARVCRTSGDPS